MEVNIAVTLWHVVFRYSTQCVDFDATYSQANYNLVRVSLDCILTTMSRRDLLLSLHAKITRAKNNKLSKAEAMEK